MSSPCTRPECGGETHTDGWGAPIRCPHETSRWFITEPGQQIEIVQPPQNIIILSGDQRTPLVTIHPSGELEYGLGYMPDEAARRFWDAMRGFVPAELNEAQAAIERVRQLHRPVEFRDRGTICAECSAFDGSSTDNSPVGYAYCATLKALNGEAP